ncbi:histidine kinase [Runella sp.]|uniref:tetratricopeptide repeat-containing sensor histidine kinase n=1 Tax=Runella sp. TaxID=1960881 RepID=UPI003D12A806
MKWRGHILPAGLLFLWLYNAQAQTIFLSNTRRLHLLDSLKQAMQSLNRQPAGFLRDTALFYTIDRYNYHFFEINRSFTEQTGKMSFYPDSMYRIAKRHQWQKGIVISAIRRADAIAYLGDKATAIGLYKEALKICEKLYLPHEQSLAFINLAICYAYRKNVTPNEWNKAMNYMATALKIALKSNDVENIHQYYNFMGDFRVIRKEHDKALPYYEAERPLMLKHRHLIGSRTNLAYLGICYLHTNREEKAWQYLNEFFSVNKSDEGSYATYLHHHVLYEISTYYLHNRKDYAKALKYQLQYEKSMHEWPIFNLASHYEAMTDIYKGLKDYPNAFRFQQLYLVARDSLKLEETSRKFAEIENRLEQERKENEIKNLQNKALNQENKAQNDYLFYLCVLFLSVLIIVGLAFYSNWLNKKKAESELRLAEERKEANNRIIQTQESERQRIAADLHDDLGGTLATIHRRINDIRQNLQDPKAAKDFNDLEPLIQKSGNDLRRISHNLMPPEFAHFGLAITLQQFIRAIPKQPTHFEFLISGKEQKFPVDVELNIYRIVSELVQNILKHAQATRASVQLIYYANLLSITVEDNGVANRLITKTKTAPGIGLKSSNLRAEYIGATLRIETNTGGTLVILEILYPSSNDSTPYKDFTH